MSLDDELQPLLLLCSLPKSWDLGHTLCITYKFCSWIVLKLVCWMKKLGQRRWVPPINPKLIILHKSPIGWEAKVELSEVETIPETSLNPRVELFVIIATNRVILKGSVERWKETSWKKERVIRFSKLKFDEKNTIALVISDDDFLFISDKKCLKVAWDDCNWMINSSASCYLTLHHDYFSSYTSSDFGSARMENDGSSKVVDKGTICLESSIAAS